MFISKPKSKFELDKAIIFSIEAKILVFTALAPNPVCLAQLKPTAFKTLFKSFLLQLPFNDS